MSPDMLKALEDNDRMRNAQKKTHPPHAHVASGWRCLLAHEDNRQCDRCLVCGEYFR